MENTQALQLAVKAIEANRIREAIRHFEKVTPIDPQVTKELVLLKARLNDLDHKIRHRLIKQDDASLEKGLIRSALLDMITIAAPELFINPPPAEKSAINPSNLPSTPPPEELNQTNQEPVLRAPFQEESHSEALLTASSSIPTAEPPNRKWLIFVLTPLLLLYPAYLFWMDRVERSIMNQMKIDAYYLIQENQANDCGMPELFNLYEPCLSENIKNRPIQERYEAFITQHDIDDSHYIPDKTLMAMTDISMRPFNNMVSINFCLQRKPDNAVGFKINIPTKVADSLFELLSTNQESWATVSENQSSFVYYKALPNDCIQLLIDKSQLPQ